MTYVGIDFSLNSPGCCIKWEDGTYLFTSFYNNSGRDPKKPIPKAFQLHDQLHKIDAIIAMSYNRKVGDKNFLTREREKLIDGIELADFIAEYLIANVGTTHVKIALEGFSYGSTGNSFIDIVQYNSMLRYRLTQTFGADNIFIFQPSHVKKNAGKGNANKHYMTKAFQDNVFNDNDLKLSKLWQYCKDKDYSEKIPKPIDDIVDSYFILQSILKLEKTLNPT
jgi:hypothetical protein